jgi:hypothetical protein
MDEFDLEGVEEAFRRGVDAPMLVKRVVCGKFCK